MTMQLIVDVGDKPLQGAADVGLLLCVQTGLGYSVPHVACFYMLWLAGLHYVLCPKLAANWFAV